MPELMLCISYNSLCLGFKEVNRRIDEEDKQIESLNQKAERMNIELRDLIEIERILAVEREESLRADMDVTFKTQWEEFLQVIDREHEDRELQQATILSLLDIVDNRLDHQEEWNDKMKEYVNAELINIMESQQNLKTDLRDRIENVINRINTDYEHVQIQIQELDDQREKDNRATNQRFDVLDSSIGELKHGVSDINYKVDRNR